MAKCIWTSKVSGGDCSRESHDESGYCLFHKPNKSDDESRLFWRVINLKRFSLKYVELIEKVLNNENVLETQKLLGDEIVRIFESNFTYEEKLNPDFMVMKEELQCLYNEANISGKQHLNPDFRGFVFPNGNINNSEYAIFRYDQNPAFDNHLNFEEVTFEGYISFEDYHFGRKTIFNHCEFLDGVTFKSAVFHNNVHFKHTKFETGNCPRRIFGNGLFSGTSFLGLIAEFSDLNEKFQFDSLSPPNFSNNTELILDNLHFSKDPGLASVGEKAYLLAKNQAMARGHYLKAGDYYYLERSYRRYSLKPSYNVWPECHSIWDTIKAPLICLKLIGENLKNNYKKIMPYLLDLIMCGLTGYGEKPSRIVCCSIATIFIFAVGNFIFADTSYIDSIFYSSITFTTLGAKIPNPDSLNAYMKIALAAESCIGALFIALFVLTISKRYAR